MKYKDSVGRVHDTETDGINPSSHNGWLFTAVMKKLMGGTQPILDNHAGAYCAKNKMRHPNVYKIKAPPISRDEIIGLAYLGYLKPHHLEGWNFSPYGLPKLNPFKLIAQLNQLWSINPKEGVWFKLFGPIYIRHRNYFWENNLHQMYHLAFSVPYSDRHFILQCWGKYNPIWHLIHVIKMRKQPENRSARQLRYLKTGKDKEAVRNYFGEDHPLSKL